MLPHRSECLAIVHKIRSSKLSSGSQRSAAASDLESERARTGPAKAYVGARPRREGPRERLSGSIPELNR